MTSEFLGEIFSLLKFNKSLPYYQAERRLDIFFNFFIEEILNYFLKSENVKFVVPEFPLKKDESRRSTKIDYVCFDVLKKEIYFVELKTDKLSLKESQFDIYCKYVEWGRCLDELNIISKNQPAKYDGKFMRFKERLSEFGLMSSESRLFPIKLLYITPEAGKLEGKNCNTITFKDLEHFKSKLYPQEWTMFNETILKT